MQRIDLIKINFTLMERDRIGEAFLWSFGTAALLSGSPMTALFLAGALSLATAVSQIVKPIFMGLLGYSAFDKPELIVRFANNVVVLYATAVLINHFHFISVHWVAVALIAVGVAWMEEKSLVRDAQCYLKLEAIFAVCLYRFARKVCFSFQKKEAPYYPSRGCLE